MAEREPPSYSVVIPTFNRARLVTEAIDSVLAQRYPRLEIVVVDDGSTDGTAAAVRRYGGPVRYVRQGNQGAAAARNAGLRRCRGDYVGLLDSDDVWAPDKIRHDLATFAAHPAADVVVGDVDCFVRGELHFPSLMHVGEIDFPGLVPRRIGADVPRLAQGSLMSTSAMTFRREALGRLGDQVYDPALRYEEDWDLEFRLLAGFHVVLSPALVGTYRLSDDGTRPFGLRDGGRTGADEAHMRRNALTILRRYADWEVWSDELRAALRRRRAELERSGSAP